MLLQTEILGRVDDLPVTPNTELNLGLHARQNDPQFSCPPTCAVFRWLSWMSIQVRCLILPSLEEFVATLIPLPLPPIHYS